MNDRELTIRGLLVDLDGETIGVENAVDSEAYFPLESVVRDGRAFRLASFASDTRVAIYLEVALEKVSRNAAPRQAGRPSPSLPGRPTRRVPDTLREMVEGR